MGRIPTATSSDAKASPARSARCHLKTRFGFSPCSIARRATDTPGSQASLANCRRNSRGNSGCLYVNVSSVLLLPEWSPLLIWWGSLWQLLSHRRDGAGDTLTRQRHLIVPLSPGEEVREGQRVYVNLQDCGQFAVPASQVMLLRPAG